MRANEARLSSLATAVAESTAKLDAYTAKLDTYFAERERRRQRVQRRSTHTQQQQQQQQLHHQMPAEDSLSEPQAPSAVRLGSVAAVSTRFDKPPQHSQQPHPPAQPAHAQPLRPPQPTAEHTHAHAHAHTRAYVQPPQPPQPRAGSGRRGSSDAAQVLAELEQSEAEFESKCGSCYFVA